MEVIRTRAELESNIATLADYLAHAPGTPERAFARGLVKLGICFVATTRDGAPFFSPSRFIGYVDNSRSAHMANAEKHGGVTNPAISEVLGSSPEPNLTLESMYLDFCKHLGIVPKPSGSYGLRRKFWNAT